MTNVNISRIRNDVQGLDTVAPNSY